VNHNRAGNPISGVARVFSGGGATGGARALTGGATAPTCTPLATPLNRM